MVILVEFDYRQETNRMTIRFLLSIELSTNDRYHSNRERSMLLHNSHLYNRQYAAEMFDHNWNLLPSRDLQHISKWVRRSELTIWKEINIRIFLLLHLVVYHKRDRSLDDIDNQCHMNHWFHLYELKNQEKKSIGFFYQFTAFIPLSWPIMWSFAEATFRLIPSVHT